MISKKYPIKILEEELKLREEQMDSYQKTLKSIKDSVNKYHASIIEITERISGLKDALYKLKGLDNLEKKNKIADPAGSSEQEKKTWQRFDTHYKHDGRQFYCEWLQCGKQIRDHKVYEFIGEVLA